MSGEVLLRGRYFSHMRKLGTVGLIATGLTGVATYYGVYKRRDSKMEAYKRSMTPEQLKAIDTRVHKYTGLTYNEEYPNIPMYDLTSDVAKEGYDKFADEVSAYVGKWAVLTKQLQSEDPGIDAAVAKVAIANYSGKVKVYTSPKAQKALKEAKDRIQKATDSYYENNLAYYMDYLSELDCLKAKFDEDSGKLLALYEDEFTTTDEEGNLKHRENEEIDEAVLEKFNIAKDRMRSTLLQIRQKINTKDGVIELMRLLCQIRGANLEVQT